MKRMSLISMLGLSALLSGCPEASPGPSKSCLKLFEQCALSDGSIGVCSEAPCDDRAQSGCLRCQSQH